MSLIGHFSGARCCNARCMFPTRFLPVSGRFEANSKSAPAGRPWPTASASRSSIRSSSPPTIRRIVSWFLPGDIARGHGEAGSIREMVDHAITTFAADRSKVFVTGFSAGGAMASVMLPTYPEVFAGGALIAGLPYGCASNVQQAFEAMFTERKHAAQGLGDRV